MRRIPFWSQTEKDDDNPVGVEAGEYTLPAPLPVSDNAPPVIDAWTQEDPASAYISALTRDITQVKAADLYQYGAGVRRILVMRKLQYMGYYGPGDDLPDLSGLNDKGKALLKHLENPKVQALLATIRYAEGTLGSRGYNTGFNYTPIHDLSWHPMTTWGLGSSAAGAYQAMDFSYPPAAAAIGVKDFTPISQDLFALHQIVHKHGIDLNGFDDAQVIDLIYDKLSKEWASMPDRTGFSRYTFKGRRQPAKSIDSLWNVYADAVNGKLPEPGYRYHHWNAVTDKALRDYQFAYEVKADGNLGPETYAAVFEGVFGTAGVQKDAVAEMPSEELKAETPVVKPWVEVSPHNVVEAKLNEKVGGYRVSSLFGPRKSPCAGCSSFHPAWDIATPSGTPIYAPFDGIEVTTFYTEGSGHVLRFTYDGMEYSLLHMSKVMPGGYEKGWVMGYTGATGRGTGPHLDVRVKQNGQWVLPSKEVIHFMLDPTAFVNVAPDPAPETEAVPPEPASEGDEVMQDDAPPVEEPAPDAPRSWWQRLFGR